MLLTSLSFLALCDPAAHIAWSHQLLGGEALEQQAFTSCWNFDVQHSSGHERHPEW